VGGQETHGSRPDYPRGASNINRRQPKFAVRAYFFWIDDVESVTDELRVNVRNIRRNVKHLDGIAMKWLSEQAFC
jgi:hypothetical protein